MSNNKLRQSSINFLTGNPYLDNSNGRLNKLNYLNIDQNVLPLRTRKNDMIHRTVFGMEDPFIRNRYYDNYSYIPKDFYNRYLQQIIFRRNSIIEFPLFNSNYIVNTRKTRFYRKGSSGSRDDLFYFAQHNDPVQIYLGQLQAHDFWIKQNLYNTFPTNTSTIVEATSSNVNDFATILEFSFKQTDTNIAAYELAAIDFYSSVGILLFFFIFFLFKFKLTVFFPRIYLQQMQKKINASLSLIKKNNFMLFLPTIYRNIDDTTNIHDIKISFKLASVIKFFPDPATALAESIWDFHNDLMFYLIAIVGLVMMLLVFILFYFWLPLKNRLVFRKNYFVELKNVYQAKNSPGADFTYRLSKPYPIIVPSKKNYDVKLEIVLTIVPALILVAIMIPSFALLYSMDEILVSHYTIRVIGHQWYWSYEYAVTKNPRLLFEEKLSIFKWINLCNYGFKPFYERLGLYQSDKEDVDAYVTMFQIYAQYKKPFVRALRRIHLAFDSTMIPTEDLKRGNLRLLEVSLSPRLLVNKVGRILVTSDDVLHSWAIPAFGIKIDACPGRLNQVTVLPERTGVFYGQCSEICGVNHGFMPISVRVVQYSDFMFFLSLWKTGRAKLPNLW
jgi:heme/copper-type cytochrome/quinol oxidase subunit 2